MAAQEKAGLGAYAMAVDMKANSARIPRLAFVRGVGLTPRVFETFMKADPAPIEALPSSYLPTVSRHVESVAPSKNVYATYWCPIVVEDKAGVRHMMHVDPLVVRTFRRTVAEELQHVREKRKRMLKRMRVIRDDFPEAQAQDIIARLEREIADAEGRKDAKLLASLQSLPESTTAIHIFLEMTSYMMQVELVCEHLIAELPTVAAEKGIQQVSFSVLSPSSRDQEGALPSYAPFDVTDSGSWRSACEWLASLRSPGKAGDSTESSGRSHAGFHLSGALRWATTSGAFSGDSSPAVVVVACSSPDDIDACKGLVRRSHVNLQIIGVFGLCPHDPEPSFQELADHAERGSALQLFFGPTYWTQFIAARQRQLRSAEASLAESARGKGMLSSDGEIVSAKVYEMRLIERFMRECYSEEQQCEQELTCATQVLERTLIDREDLLAVLRGDNGHGQLALSAPANPASLSAPATTRS